MRRTKGERTFELVNYVVLSVVAFATLYPMLNILAQSFSNEVAIRTSKVNLWPVGFNWQTYQAVTSDAMFWRNYANTVLYTVVATTISMVLTTSYAYVLSKKYLRGRTLLIWIAVFTMFFSGGLIPNYVLIDALGWKNTIWAVVVPGAISVFNLLIMKSSFEALPVEMEEAAAIDGLSPIQTLIRIYLPLSKAILATMILFYAVANWNAWFGAFLYFDRRELLPVTIYLRNLIAGVTSANDVGAAGNIDAQTQINANIKAVTVVLTTVPILCVYPFVQKYYVSGVMLGSVKG